MYALNSTVSVEFIIPPTATVPVQSDLDVVVLRPVSGRTYTDSALTSYVAPTYSEQGKGTYSVVLDEAGRYRFTLSTGVSGQYQEISQVEIFVVDKSSISAAIANSIQTSITCPIVVIT